MYSYVVLLRGINVGGHNKLPMGPLRETLTAYGWHAVSTIVQSGNIVGQCSHANADAAASEIRTLLLDEFNLTPQVLVLDAAGYAQIMRTIPWPDGDPRTVHLYFLAEPAVPTSVAALESLAANDEQVHLTDDCLHLLAPSGIGRSKLAAAVEKRLGVSCTARNLSTANKILALLNQ